MSALWEDKIYRDDREQLKRLATMAGAWFGRKRNIINVNLQHLFVFNELGYIMTDIYSGGSFVSSGTPITQIGYDFISQKMTIDTEFDNIDFSVIAARLRNKQVTSLTRRIGRIEDKLQQIPLRIGTNASGDNYEGYFKVIQTATGYSVINGSDADDVNCGYVKAGNSRLPALKTNFLTADVTTDGAFYIETTYTTSYQVKIKFAATLPDAVNGKDICLINDLKDETPIQKLFGEHNIMRWA